MSNERLREALERERARLLAEAEAIERDLADIDRLTKIAAKYNLAVKLTPPTVAPSAPEAEVASGTVADLVRQYQTDPRSPYHTLHFKSRELYDTLANRMLKDCHDWRLSDLNDRTVRQLYDIWTEGGKKVAIGHSLIASLRRLANFGRATLEDPQCVRLSMVLHNTRVSAAGKRTEQLTDEQANAIRAEAHRQGQHSLALAQAFQFDLQLRQKDVIGEWVPLKEPGTSDVVAFGKKWLRGLRWNQIDNLILRATISSPRREPQDKEFNLRDAPMVREELKLLGDALPASGPMIVRESTGRPWREVDFRQKWREIADACGIPKEIRNSDSRPRAASTRAIKAAEDVAPAARR